MIATLIVIVLILALIGGLPSMSWNSGRGWGYAPSSIIGTILIVVVVLWLLRRL